MKERSKNVIFIVYDKGLGLPLEAGSSGVLFNMCDFRDGDVRVSGFRTKKAAERAIDKTMEYAKEVNYGWKREDYKIWKVTQ